MLHSGVAHAAETWPVEACRLVEAGKPVEADRPVEAGRPVEVGRPMEAGKLPVVAVALIELDLTNSPESESQ